MSLFKVEELWSVKIGGENFAASTLIVGKFLSKLNKSDQIICGSLNGKIKIYSQRECNSKSNQLNLSSTRDTSDKTTVNSDGDTNPFSMIRSQNDIELIMESDIKIPIIQIVAGRFITDRPISVAVLSQQKLIMMIVDEDSLSFKMMEEFSFQRVAYNLCYGNFGHVSDRDFICVQSTDGTLAFYVNGHLSFTTYLASALIPGPIAYGHDDSIVVVSGSRYLEGYKYKNLAVSHASSGPSTTQKKVLPDWSVNIGETAIDIRMCNSTKDGALIVVLSRYSFIMVNNNTGIVLKKRFESRLRSLICYNDAKFIITTNTGELMVFMDTSLRWKAYIGSGNVVGLSLGNFNDISNFIVSLTDHGQLSVVFLGTEPSIGSINLPIDRESISENNDMELARLQQKIKTITTTQGSTTVRLKPKESRSFLKATVDLSSAYITPQEGASPVYTVDLRLKSSADITNVMVRLSIRKPLIVKESFYHLTSITSDREVLRSITVITSGAMVVCSLKLLIFITYDSPDQVLTTSKTFIHLPLSLVLESCPPCKQATFKVTLDTNQDTLPLKQFFPDIICTKGDVDVHSDVAIGLRYYNEGPMVTLLASASSKKYRLQSDHFEALWLVVKELKNRLSQHFGKNFSMSYTDALPLDAYFLNLDFHFSLRQNLNQFNHLLEDRSRQFRAIEKLLLTKTKDKAETSLHNLETLLENSISQVVHLSELVEEQQLHLSIVGTALSSATSLIGFLLQSSAVTMTESQRSLIESALSGTTRDFPEMGLEEVYSQIFIHLLKQVAGRDSQTLVMPVLEIPDNIDKLKKHIKALCDRVCRGVKLSSVPLENEVIVTNEREESNFNNDLKFVVSPRVTVHNKSKKSKRKQNKMEALN